MVKMSDGELIEKVTDAVLGPSATEINALLETGSVNDISNIVQSFAAIIHTFQLMHTKG